MDQCITRSALRLIPVIWHTTRIPVILRASRRIHNRMIIIERTP